MKNNSISRRDFLSSVAMVGAAGALGTGVLLPSCTETKAPSFKPLKPESEWNVYQGVLPDKAKDGKLLKAGVIGCGGRGSGAIQNFMDAGPNLTIVALGDMFPDRIANCRKLLKDKYNVDIPEDKCFSGFDNYKKVIDAGVDVVIDASPPAFRPRHFKAAVDAGKHVFLEKPIAVDPTGVRSVIADSKRALAQGLCVITGTHRHHQRCYIEGYKQVQSGLIGEIVGGNIYFNQGMLWYRTKENNWTNMEWMIRDWVNWTWLSGDHIVEQHVHDIDLFNWFSGQKPLKALGFGARQRRITGNQYDMFSVDYLYEGGYHVHSMCRQINGCANNVSAFIQGTKGAWIGGGEERKAHTIVDLKGNVIWQFDFAKEEAEFKQIAPHYLEHVSWVNHIRDNKPISQAEETAISTLTAIMGRISAYTGLEVSWDEAMASNMNLMPDNLELKDVDLSQYTVAVPGRA